MSKRERVQMRREMGMIFQSAALFDSLSVLENVRFPLDMFSNMTAAEASFQARFLEVCRSVSPSPAPSS